MAALADGSPVFAADVSATTNFGGPDIVHNGGLWAVAVVKLTPGGDYDWQIATVDPASDMIASGLVVDAAGRILVSGRFTQAITFPGAPTMTSFGAADSYLVKLDPAKGDVVWQHQFQNGAAGDPTVAADGLGRVAFSGFFYGTTNLGGDDLPNVDPADADVVVGSFMP